MNCGLVNSIMIVGVGGQGTLLDESSSRGCADESGYDVKVSEVHGMSQRGGAVVTYVKYGDKVDSPIVEKGEADLLLAFELLEAARWFEFIKPDGTLIVNTQQIDPMPVVIGSQSYPEGVLDALSASGAEVITVKCSAVGHRSGLSKAVNVVLVGAMAKTYAVSAEVGGRPLSKPFPRSSLR